MSLRFRGLELTIPGANQGHLYVKIRALSRGIGGTNRKTENLAIFFFVAEKQTGYNYVCDPKIMLHMRYSSAEP